MKKVYNSLVVAETFYSIQGEGVTVGIPAVFLRLGGCNLLCKGSGWVCDTIDVWQHGKMKKFPDVLSLEMIEHLKKGAHLVITGGEPLMQQAALVEYLVALSQYVTPIIEMETNGTIVPCAELQSWVSYWNVSPKLSNSGEMLDRRRNDLALKCFITQCDQVIFKFVVSEEKDIWEIIEYDLPKYLTMLMPAGATQDELAITRPLVAELCKQHKLRYTDRAHVVIWNKKTGV